MFTTSYWELGKLAFIGHWYNLVTKADILVHLKSVHAQFVCATLIHKQNNRKALREAGFKPIAYGGRNGGAYGSIHLWMIENPFYPQKGIDPYEPQSEDYNSYSCGVYNSLQRFSPPKNRIYLTKQKLKGGRVLCPGWYVHGKPGHSWFYI